MKGKRFLALAVASCLGASPALAVDIVDKLLSELRRGGFNEIDIGRTLLGRTRIIAESPEAKREIVVDPRTGEILRDYWEFFGAAGVSGPGDDDDDDDDDGDDDDDDDDDDDNSGSGSSNSGSGSSNSGSGSSNSGSGGGSSGSGGDDSEDD